MVCFAMIPSLVLAVALLDRNAQMLKTSSREVRLTSTEALATSLDGLLLDALEQLAGVAQALGNPDLDPPVKLGLVQTLVSSSSSIDHALVFDASGQHIDTIRHEGLTYSPDTEPIPAPVREALQARGRFVSDDLVTREGGVDRVRMGVPLKSRAGEVTGFVLADVPLASIQKKRALLVDEKFDGDQLGLNLVNIQGKRLLQDRDDDASRLDPALVERARELAALKKVATSEEITERDSSEQALVTFKPLEQAPWLIVSRVPRSIAYAPLMTMRIAVLIALGLVLMLGVIVAILFSRQITRPVNALMHQCRAIAQRRFSARVELDSSDELGVLARTLNDSARELEESEQELLRQERIRNDLGRYLPHELVERVVLNERKDGAEQDAYLSLKGREEEITVLFADVVGFTEICQHLSPQDTVTILNELFTILTEIIFRHGGVVDKFIGDSIMAFWGAPEPNADHAVDACSAAEEILSWLELGNVAWKERYDIEISLAIGMHSGPAVVGNVGSDTRLAYTAIGDTVNLAARLESIARPNQILTSRSTATLLDDLFETHYAGERLMPGHEEPIEVYEVTP